MNLFYQKLDFTDEINNDLEESPIDSPDFPWNDFMKECDRRNSLPKLFFPNKTNIQRAMTLYLVGCALARSTYGRAIISINDRGVFCFQLFYDFFFQANRIEKDLACFTKMLVCADEIEIMAHEKKCLELSLTLVLVDGIRLDDPPYII